MDIDFASTDPSPCASGALPQVKDALEYIYDGLARVLRSIAPGVSAAKLQGCLPLLFEQVSAEELIDLAGREQYERLRSSYRASSLLNLWYSAELERVLETIRAAQIRVMVLKGADIATTLYPRPGLRYFDDVDLMVQAHDLAATVAILESLGYSYHQEYHFEAASKLRTGFVYVKEIAAGYLMFEVHTSPHPNNLGIAFDVARVWERARPITVAGRRVDGMGLEDLFIYLCWHYRSHAFDRLIWLYDIALMLCADQLDWSYARQLARQQGLLATAYYSVRWCQQLFNITIPEDAQMERLMPSIFMQGLIKYLVGEDLTAVLRRRARHKRKLLQYCMVDNVKALCLVGLRLLFPSPAHLGRLYMEHSRLPLRLYWLYYFIHPLLVLKALLVSLFHERGPRTGRADPVRTEDI